MLEALATHREGLPLKELAKAAGVSSAAAFHAVQTLVEQGYAERHDLRYTLGPRFLELTAVRERHTVSRAVDTLLRELAEALPGAHLYFSEKMGDSVVITRHLTGTASAVTEGGRHTLPPYASGGSLVHLAFWPREIAEAYEARYPFEVYGLPFWRSREAYEAALAEMKQERGAFMREKELWRLKYAFPLFTSRGTFVGAVTVQWNHPGETTNLPKFRHQQKTMAREAAERFTHQLT